jgi:serine/threonine protein kinase
VNYSPESRTVAQRSQTERGGPGPTPGRVLKVGFEPIPGYRLLAPLGSGSFGTVWKCEAPGGLVKAIKFVEGVADGPAAQELRALERVKSIRHPFIVALERIEVVEGVLLIVMELADRSLIQLHADYQEHGQIGIPREELLRYLAEAAEALDWMNFEHGLQHLDVKPHNLFLVGRHIKVADFGLVDRLWESTGGGPASPRSRGLTPLYAPPELLGGTLSRHSDQYSLAIVYQQMLTGTVPFWAPDLRQLVDQHRLAEPSLNALSVRDRAAVARALSKNPSERFPSCLAFIEALACGSPPSEAPDTASPDRSNAAPNRATRPVRLLPANLVGTRRMEKSSRPTHSTPADLRPGGSFPGWTLQECLGQAPLGELWTARAKDDRVRWALCLPASLGDKAREAARLGAVRHPALLATEVVISPEGRVALLTEPHGFTLRDRFDEYRARGRPGIPREELIGQLRGIAGALDELARREGLRHLGLNPRAVLVRPERLLLAYFGLVPLVWLPAGLPPWQLNGRYAAPELSTANDSETADLYSLALIYAEMLTGLHPLRQRPGSGPVKASRRSGLVSSRSEVRGPVSLDLDLLPACDREVVARALSPDPGQRFATCTALFDALLAATPRAEERVRPLSGIIPFASLHGQAITPSLRGNEEQADLPPLAAILDALGGHRPRPAWDHTTRCIVAPDGSWEFRCPIRLFPGALRLRAEGFCQHWNGRSLPREGEAFACVIELGPVRRFWERWVGPTGPSLEVDIGLDPPLPSGAGLTEAVARLRILGARGQAEQMLKAIGPRVLQSLHTYLQASPEQRRRQRWSCRHPLHVYPVLPGQEIGAPIEAAGRDLSCGGIRFCCSVSPPAEWVYLHWYACPSVADLAVLARVQWSRPVENGHEIGAAFLIQTEEVESARPAGVG